MTTVTHTKLHAHLEISSRKLLDLARMHLNIIIMQTSVCMHAFLLVAAGCAFCNED